LTLLHLADVTINDMRHHTITVPEIIIYHSHCHLTGMIHPYSFVGNTSPRPYGRLPMIPLLPHEGDFATKDYNT